MATYSLGMGLPVYCFGFCRAMEPLSPAGEAVVIGTDVIHQADLWGNGVLR